MIFDADHRKAIRTRCVMAGLDPAIHLKKKVSGMDCRVKPGNDNPLLLKATCPDDDYAGI
ncbi:MAG: hypothetical protein CL533_08680 [Afipia sp.]|nr:hypothetical protein [Afipia sp.]OUX61309.1 MAG: hypothetical protein CBB64_08655 [Afipia sp. TMED4]